jgi:hypothetical protein
MRKQLGQRVRILTGIGLSEAGTIVAHEHDQDRRVTSIASPSSQLDVIQTRPARSYSTESRA